MPMIQQRFSLMQSRPINVFQLLDKFKKVSGLEVNSSKTEGVWRGSLKGIKWPKDPLKALRIFFSTIKNCST